MASGRDVFMAFLEFWLLALLAWGSFALATYFSGLMQSFCVTIGGFFGLFAIISLIGRTLSWFGFREFEITLADIWQYVLLLIALLGVAALTLV